MTCTLQMQCSLPLPGPGVAGLLRTVCLVLPKRGRGGGLGAFFPPLEHRQGGMETRKHGQQIRLVRGGKLEATTGESSARR